MEKSSEVSLDEVAAKSMDAARVDSQGFKLESPTFKVKIKNIDAVKYAFSGGLMQNVLRYVILHNGFLYEINFAASTIEDFNKYFTDFEKSVQNIEIGN
jgi:hypothetical protein